VRPIYDSIDQQTPRLNGCDLIVRPDVHAQLERAFGGLAGLSHLSVTEGNIAD
jgi:hypothetical protein